MNPYKHSEISVARRGGIIEDYYPIHFFMDSTKELCSDNRHRILHNLWGIRRVIIPIFGAIIINADGKQVDVKDLCEQDHILPDYRNKFIPNLADFVDAMTASADLDAHLEAIFNQYKDHVAAVELLLSPLSITGRKKSLLLTHNSWFLNTILPKILPIQIKLQHFPISPADIFNNMQFELWMDNGATYPPSAQKLNEHKINLI